MKENYTQLYPNDRVAAAVGDYAFNHSTALPSHITKYHELGSAHEKSGYMISPFQAQFQLWIAKAFGAKRSKPSRVFHQSLGGVWRGRHVGYAVLYDPNHTAEIRL